MSDSVLDNSLYRIAESQAGHFTAAQAKEAGVAPSTLRYHARLNGRFERIGGGLYRLKYYPVGANDHIMAAWLPMQGTGAIVSHQSALQLHDLADLEPGEVHLTVPRSKRGARSRQGVRLHTTQDYPARNEQRTIEGISVTSVERTIVDLLEAGERTEQIEMAILQAVERGYTTQRRLRSAGAASSNAVMRFIESALEEPYT